jgi:hypothetical protein
VPGFSDSALTRSCRRPSIPLRGSICAYLFDPPRVYAPPFDEKLHTSWYLSSAGPQGSMVQLETKEGKRLV